jgi:DNA-binding NtrC family response regulator
MRTMKIRATVVLVVEDEPLIRMNVVDALSDACIETLEAATADEAIRILAERDDIGVVFTDVHMPGSLDGFELSARIRLEWPRVAVIITSGLARISRQKLPARTFFFEKPYDHSTIVDAIQQLVEDSRGRRTAARLTAHSSHEQRHYR